MNKQSQKYFQILFFSVLMVLAMPYAARADLVTSASDLGANDFLEWSTLGSNGIQKTSGFTTSSDSGRSLTVHSGAGGDLLRVNEGALATGWLGNFAIGTPLLRTLDGSGRITFVFERPIIGAGAQVQANLAPGTGFDAFISAFDANDTLLETVTLNGISTDALDNSAIFIGILTPTFAITKLEFSVSNGDLAIARLELAVPLPTAFWLFGSGLLGLAVRRRIAARA